MKALFIGRFQPFHNGHLKVIQKASKEYDEIIIGIGSSQYRDALENPFTSEERELMIQRSLDEINIKNYRIVLIPDIHNPPKWVEHVLSIFSDFDVVLANSSFTKKLFIEAGYNVEKTELYDRDFLCGKEIRRRINDDEKWQNLVPSEVSKLISKVDGMNRIKKLFLT